MARSAAAYCCLFAAPAAARPAAACAGSAGVGHFDPTQKKGPSVTNMTDPAACCGWCSEAYGTALWTLWTEDGDYCDCYSSDSARQAKNGATSNAALTPPPTPPTPPPAPGPPPATGTWRGVDMSQLATEDGGGADPPFRAAAGGAKTDALALLRAHGAGTFRMRMWNAPCADGRCDPAKYSYANLTGVLQMARRCHTAGLAFILDLHYSDWWADPGQQYKPTAWASLPFDGLVAAVGNFTRDTVRALVDQHTPPVAVQIGNEVSNGFLWEGDGAGCESGGRLWCGGDAGGSWRRFGALVAAGIRGSREGCAGCAIAMHTDLGNHIADKGIDYVVGWHRDLAQNLGGETFDLVGLSMYPTWDGGHTMANIAQLGALAAAFPTTPIYIAETSYPAAGNEQPEAYPATPAGQLAFLSAVRAAMAGALPAAQQGGVLWWEGDEHGWSALFDGDYVARPALLQGFASNAAGA